ncbi:hypothetical protein AYI69_g3119 [Smittium culicis]|uniref:Uncharacterized protein n=1 Tax=Smittium culicis TaxID=133412 RepID=A0A1R1YKK3_9FUNG|nr:hypothetical protein AYI69_g11409 [Smittium culicis]OMJ27449.1 hypothetical protein AYI69_g3119 [Smittium culicis]
MYSVKTVLTLALAFTAVKKGYSETLIVPARNNDNQISTDVNIPWESILNELAVAKEDVNFKKTFTNNQVNPCRDPEMHSFKIREAQIRQIIGGKEKTKRVVMSTDDPEEFSSVFVDIVQISSDYGSSGKVLPFLNKPYYFGPNEFGCRPSVFGLDVSQISPSSGGYPPQCLTPVGSTVQSVPQTSGTNNQPAPYQGNDQNGVDQQTVTENVVHQSGGDNNPDKIPGSEPQNLALPTEKAEVSDCVSEWEQPSMRAYCEDRYVAMQYLVALGDQSLLWGQASNG